MGIGSESAQAQTSARRPLCGQVRALAAQLHDKMHQLFSVVNNGVPTKVSWFRLFKHMDDDESGLISYSELAGMVREELLFGHKELPEKTLKAVWLALDNDGSGRLTAGEFGAFMRLGARAQRSTATESPAQFSVSSLHEKTGFGYSAPKSAACALSTRPYALIAQATTRHIERACAELLARSRGPQSTSLRLRFSQP